jgi:hypothetical protein
MLVTIDGVWIGNRIYWILSQLHSITTESLRTLSVLQLTTEYLTTTESQPTDSHNWVSYHYNWLFSEDSDSNSVLNSQLTVFPNWLVMAAGLPYIAWDRTPPPKKNTHYPLLRQPTVACLAVTK